MNNSNELTPEQLEAVKAILGDKGGEKKYIDVEVPTKCRWYETNRISIRPFTFEDEKEAMSPMVKNKNFLNFILERCIKGIDIDSLFLVDRNFLVYKLKEMSTGSKVSVALTCDSCGREGTLEVDLNILNVNTVDIDFPIEINLKDVEKKALIMPPKVKDEDLMINFESICDNIWRFVREIDGISDEQVLYAVLNKLPVRDIHTIINTLALTQYGLQNEINYLCGCGTEKIVEVPLTENFFGDS
jgi:hypothetical protein